MLQKKQVISLQQINSEAGKLATEFPAATAFLEFRVYVIQQRQRQPGPHGGRLALIQPSNAKGRNPEENPAS
jgi:hypothetical protein